MMLNGIFKCEKCGGEHVYGGCVSMTPNTKGVLKINNVLGMVSIEHPRLAYAYDVINGSKAMVGIQVDEGLDEEYIKRVCYLIATNYIWLNNTLNSTGELTTITSNNLPKTTVEEVEISDTIYEIATIFVEKYGKNYNDSEIMEMLSSPLAFLLYWKDFLKS